MSDTHAQLPDPEASPRPLSDAPDLGHHSDTPSDDRASKADEARRRFLDGANCAQAVLCSFADVCGLDQRTACHLATGFGAGFGRLREVCGAVSAMTMVAGLLHGADAGDKAAKDDCYACVQRLADEFRSQTGSIICRELLGLPPRQSHAPHPPAPTPAHPRRPHPPSRAKVPPAAAILERELPNLSRPSEH